MNGVMNTTNQIFNWGRFTAALRKELVENKRQLILVVVSIFLFLTIFMVLGNILNNKMNQRFGSEVQMMDFMPSIFVMSIYSFVVMIMASLAFRNLTSKTGRVLLFTSPSSTTEKFIVNLVVYVIGTFVAFIVCAQLADLVRIAVLTPFKSKTFAVPGPMNFFSTLIDSPSNAMSIYNIFEEVGLDASSMRTMVILSFLLAPAYFFLGSVLWPRLSFLKTFAAKTVLGGIINVIVAMAFTAPFLLKASKGEVTEIDTSSLMSTVNIENGIDYAIGILCWFGAWYLFKHKDVVSLKWWK